MEEVLARLDELEKKKIDVDDLPMQQLSSRLHDDLAQNVGSKLLNHSIGADLIKAEPVSTLPHAFASRSAGFSAVAAGASQLLTFPDYGAGSQNSNLFTTTNTSRLLAPYTGLYLLSFTVDIPTGADVGIGWQVRKNSGGSSAGGSGYKYGSIGSGNAAGSGDYAITVPFYSAATPGDYFEIFWTNQSGVSKTPVYFEFDWIFIGPVLHTG